MVTRWILLSGSAVAGVAMLATVVVAQPGGERDDRRGLDGPPRMERPEGPMGHRPPGPPPPRPMAPLPDAVKSALDEAFPGAVVEESEVEDELGLSVYEVELFHDGREIEVELTDDGTILSVERETREQLLPEAVRAALGDGPVREVEELEQRAELKPVVLDHPRTVYVVKGMGPDGPREMRITAEGQVLSERRLGPPPHRGGPDRPKRMDDDGPRDDD